MLDTKHLSAEELMLIYKENHPEEAYRAFEELYRRYKDRVFGYVVSKLKSNTESEDVLQKIFLKFHDKKHLYSPKYKCEQWLFVIARTQILDHLRSNSRAFKNEQKLRDTLIENNLYNQSKEDHSLSSSILKNLSEDQLEFIQMKIIDDLSYKEMSDILNKSELSLRKSFSRLVDKMKKGEIV